MRLFALGKFLRRLLTAYGFAFAAVYLLRAEWAIELANGRIWTPETWIWTKPDLSLTTAVSTEINWGVSIGRAVGAASCTWLWWMLTGRIERYEAAHQSTRATSELRAHPEAAGAHRS